MTAYLEPDQKFIMEQLEKAGADCSTQVAGAFWIAGALLGVGHKKTPREDIEKLRKAQEYLEKAMGLINECDPWLHRGGGMDELVTQRVDKAAQALKYVTTNSPGGQREKAHRRFIDALRHFFISNDLPIALTEQSPFVSILGHCIGQDGESVKRSLVRSYRKKYLEETEEEKALRPLKDAADKAQAAYVRRLNGDHVEAAGPSKGSTTRT